MRTRREEEGIIQRAIASYCLDDTDIRNIASVIEGLDRNVTYIKEVSGMLHDLGMTARIKLQADEPEE